jgi:hypothetical protein
VIALPVRAETLHFDAFYNGVMGGFARISCIRRPGSALVFLGEKVDKNFLFHGGSI